MTGRTATAAVLLIFAGQAGEPSFLIERGRAGQFEVGMTADEVYRAAGRERVTLVATFPEGMFQPELHVRLPPFTTTPALTAPVREAPCFEFAVWGILVHDPRFRTKTGLGVGSTLGDVKRTYPAAKVTAIGTDPGPSVVIEEIGLTFKMDPAERSFTDRSRVKSVWVIPDPERVRARRCPGRGQ